MSEMPSAAGSAIQTQEKINGSAFYEEAKMDRIIQMPVWGIFWIFFIGALGGTLVAFWIDSIFEKWVEKGDPLKNLNKKLREIRSAEKD